MRWLSHQDSRFGTLRRRDPICWLRLFRIPAYGRGKSFFMCFGVGQTFSSYIHLIITSLICWYQLRSRYFTPWPHESIHCQFDWSWQLHNHSLGSAIKHPAGMYPLLIAYSSRSVKPRHHNASTSTQHSFEETRIEIVQLLGWRARLKIHLLPSTTIGAYHHHYTSGDIRILEFIRVSQPSIRLLPPSKLLHHFCPTNWNLPPVSWKFYI